MNYYCDHIGTILMFYAFCGYSAKIFGKNDLFILVSTVYYATWQNQAFLA